MFSQAKHFANLIVAQPDRGREIDCYNISSRRPRHYGDEHRHDELISYRDVGQSRRRGRSLHSEDSIHDRRHGRYHYRGSSRVRSHSEHRLAEAATAALTAGLTEAVRARHNPDRFKRTITAAVGAAAVDAFVSKGKDQKNGRHIAESAVGGLLIDRLAHGRSKK